MHNIEPVFHITMMPEMEKLLLFLCVFKIIAAGSRLLANCIASRRNLREVRLFSTSTLPCRAAGCPFTIYVARWEALGCNGRPLLE